MRKLLLLVAILIAIFMTGCNNNHNNNSTNTNNSASTNENIANSELEGASNNSAKFTSVEEYYSIINSRGNNYDEYTSPQNVFVNTRLIKKDDKVILISDIGNSSYFSYEEVTSAVEELENSGEKEIKLGAYTIHKEYVEPFFNEQIIDEKSDNDSIDKVKWLDENRIPLYITDSEGYLVKLELRNGNYYPYYNEIPLMNMAIVDTINENALQLVLDDDTSIVLYEVGKDDEHTYTAKDIFKSEKAPMYGISFHNSDSFKISNGVVHICTGAVENP